MVILVVLCQKFTNFSVVAIVVGNMSTAKCTPTEIAKALIEEISDEEGEPHSKKPRRASQKNKANEKKEKQHAVQLATCYLRAKVTELATLVPCAFYDLPLPQYV